MKIDHKKLLKDKKVIQEINRHKWLESEIAGYDIGFEKAAEDWLRRYAADWLKYYQPKNKSVKPSNSSPKTVKSKK